MPVDGVRDAGSVGQLVSLAGVKGRPGAGLIYYTDTVPITAGTVVQVLPARPERVWAIIQNSSTDPANSNRVRVVLGPEPSVIDGYLELQPGGDFEIDQDNPWTGGVNISEGGVGGAVVNVVEARVAT